MEKVLNIFIILVGAIVVFGAVFGALAVVIFRWFKKRALGFERNYLRPKGFLGKAISVAVPLGKEILDSKTHGSQYHYGRKDYFMSRPEHEYFDALQKAVGDTYYIFPQAHLDRLVYSKYENGNALYALRHVNQKSVDYVLCDKAYLAPVLAIELDDHSHEQESRIKRDEEVERILHDAGLPLLRLENHGAPDVELLKVSIREKVENKSPTP